MSNKKGLVLLISAMMLLSLLPLVLADNLGDAVAGATVAEGASGTFTESAATTDDAQGGNVTEVNLSTAASTTKWAGYYGQVSASLSLGISTNALFSFGDVQNDQIKSVFATKDIAFKFSDINAGTQAGLDANWTFTTTDSDSATVAIGGNTTTISGIASVPALPLNSYSAAGVLSTTTFLSGILVDTENVAKADYAFGVSVSPNVRDFSNSTVVDYELVVPITDGATPETYYFFMDIQ